MNTLKSLLCCVLFLLAAQAAYSEVVSAFYVATNGSDSNSGTLAQPFATLAKCQMAMRANSTTKTCYIRAGTYSPPAVTAHSNCEFGDPSGSSIALDPRDGGETWSYYPPDGYGSAILNGQSTIGGSGKSGGGNGTGCGFGDYKAAHLTINGLQFENYQFSAFWGSSASNLTFVNNTVHDLTSARFDAGGVALVDSPGVVISNNYMYNIAYIGVGFWQATMGGEGNITVNNNAIINSCTWPVVPRGGNDQNGGDCGAIYFADRVSPSATNIRVLNNYVRDVNKASNGIGDFGHCCADGIYLDDGASNVTASGNVTAGTISDCFHIHGGNNNVMTGNICDLDSSGSESVVLYAWHKLQYPMSGNVFENNIVINDSHGGGDGYAGFGFGGQPPPNPMTIKNNAYYNYVGSTLASNGTRGAGSDANPTYVNPQLSCWTYNLASGSPVYQAPVNFPQQPPNWGQPGFWGPPGFVIPQTGTPPSSPST
jgi:hypothetical protein